jgi:predicted ribosomally synthesized peptide with SipW-like signal peptide
MKKIGLLCLALVLALGSLGVGYAAWTDQIVINGTVNTGTLCFGFDDYFLVNDPCEPPTPDWTCDVGFGNKRIVPEGKNVGCTTVTWVDLHTVEITITNAYPCYLSTVSMHMINCGTVPLRIKAVNLTYPDPYNPGYDATVALLDSVITYIPGETQYVDPAIDNVIEIKWVNGIGTQLEPDGGEHESSFHLHVLQPAKPGSQYTFTITVDAIQWDEYTD